MLDLQQTVDHVLLLAERSGLKEVDALIERDEALEVEIRDGKVEKVEQSTSLGLGIRILKEGRSGFSSTEKLDPDTLARTLAQARSNSEFQDPTEVFMPAVTQSSVDPENLELFEPDLGELVADSRHLQKSLPQTQHIARTSS